MTACPPPVRRSDKVHGTGGRVYICPTVAACDAILAKLCATTGAARRGNKLDIDKLLARRLALTSADQG